MDVAVLIKNESDLANEQVKNVLVKETWLKRKWIAIFHRYKFSRHWSNI